MSISLRCHLFGSFQISLNGRPLPKPATLKSQSLLAYLLLHRQVPQQRDRLCNFFWRERPESKARGSLSTALWQIQRCLPEGRFILSKGEAVQFNPEVDVWLDVEEFIARISMNNLDSLRSGTDLYGGDFLVGFYDDWVIDERYHLEGLYCTALERLMAAQEMAGKYEDALTVAERLLRYDPLRENAHRLKMRAYRQLGQRNAALKQYQICREIILAQLGVEPMEETTRLYQIIMDQRWEPAVTHPSIPLSEISSLLSRAHLGYDPLDVTAFCPLIGRESDIALLDRYWTKTVAGRGKLIFIGGEAGVGKTRLVDEFIRNLLLRGIRILSGRCYEFERILPYQPIVETLQSAWPALSASERKLFPRWLVPDESARPAAELNENVRDMEAPSDLHHDQAHLFDGVLHFLAELSSQGPILILLEDLHWASESTLQMVHYLARYLVKHPIMLVLTYRSENIAQQRSLSNLKQVLQKENIAISMDLSRLSASQTESLISQMSGGARSIGPLAQRLYQETEGNPFFLMEMVKALFEAGAIHIEANEWRGDLDQISQRQLPLPQSITEAILARIQNLNRDTQNALHLAAILGREFDFELLNQALGRGNEVTLRALDVLLRQRLIEEGSGFASRDYVFTHHKIQEIIYEALPRHRRQLLHSRVAMAFEKLNLEQEELFAGEVAHHFERCQELGSSFRDRAVKYLLRAGDRARFLYAFQDALDYYGRALTILRRVKRYDRAADTLMKMGLTYHTCLDFEHSREAYEEGLALRQSSQLQRPGLPPAPHPLRVSWREPNSLDPVLASFEWSTRILDQLFCGLVNITPELDILPDVAYAWDVLDGGHRYNFHLRQDVTWSDGVPVTACDFECAWTRALLPTCDSPFTELLADIKGARAFHQGETSNRGDVGICAMDEFTLRVELEEPNGYFLHLVSYLFPIPRHVVEAQGENWAQAQNIVTNGPFQLQEWCPGRSIVLSRNPRYHGDFTGNVEQVELCLDPSMSTQLDLYEAGKLDFFDIWTLPLEGRDRARQRNAAEYISLPEASTFFVGYDTSRPPFDDPRIRRAFAMATDREKLANVVMRGCVAPATGGLIPPGMPAHSPGIGLPRDIRGARQLLSDVGDLAYLRDTFSSIAALLPSGSLVPYARSLQAQWKESLGIEIAWQSLDPGSFLERMKVNLPEMHLLGWMPDCPDPGSLFPPSRIYQHTHWQNNCYDNLLKEARQTTAPASRMRLYQEADKILIEEAVLVPLTYGRTLLLVKPWVKNFSTSSLTRWLWKDIVIEPH